MSQHPTAMPIQRTITLYSFDELSDEAKMNAVEKMRDVNTDHDWWEFVYDDARTIGFSIHSFNLDHNTIEGHLDDSVLESCKSVRKNHGKDCDTFNTARRYLRDYCNAFIRWLGVQEPNEKMTRLDWFDEFHDSDEAADVEEEYKKAILEDYLSLLRKEYDYQTSDELVIETIKANEYLFDTCMLENSNNTLEH